MKTQTWFAHVLKPLMVLALMALAVSMVFSAPLPADAAPKNTSGNALNFDGVNAWVDASQNGGAKNSATNLSLPTGDIVVEAWVNPRTFTAWTSLATFIQDNGSFEYGWGLGIYDASGHYYFALASVGRPLTYLTTADAFPTNQWTHVAGVYDGTTMQIFVNGVLEGTSTAQSGSIAYANSWLAIGAYKDDDEFYPLDGQLDEVRIWDLTRTAAVIRANMFKELGATIGLKAVYHFNESSGTTAADSSGFGHNGTLTGFSGTPWRTSGAFSGPRNALDFDGTDDNVSTPNSVSGDAAFTVEAWIYHSGATFSSHDTIVEFGDDAPYLGLANGIPEIYKTCTASQALLHNRWYHIAWVKYSSSSFAIYVDGAQACSSTTSTSLFNGADMGIGYNVGDTRWTGKIDQVQLWNVGRTAAQIRDDMAHELVGNETGLVTDYRFDQGLAGGNNTGNNTLYDLTSNANNGTLNNFALSGSTSNWVSSSAFNTWIGAEGTDWATAGNWSRSAAPVSTDNVGIYSYSGGNAPALGGASTVNHLVVVSPLAANANLTVNGNLFLDADLTASGSNVVILGSSATVNGAYDVIGTTRRASPGTGTALQFNNQFTTFNFATAPTQMDVTLTKSKPAEFTTAVSRYYTLTPTGGVNATIQLAYKASEANGTTEANNTLWRYDTGASRFVLQGGTANTTDATWHYVSLAGVTQFSDWAITNDGGPTAVKLSSFKATAPSFDLGVWFRKMLGR